MKLTPYLASFGYTQEDIDWMVEHEGLTCKSGGWSEWWEDTEFRAECIRRMREENPMFDPDVIKKGIETKLKRYGTLSLKVMSDKERGEVSKRMKENNPQHMPGNKCRRWAESPSKGKKAYNNGIINRYFEEGLEPQGWTRGLIFKARK